jgi:hypothetical protein
MTSSTVPGTWSSSENNLSFEFCNLYGKCDGDSRYGGGGGGGREGKFDL